MHSDISIFAHLWPTQCMTILALQLFSITKCPLCASCDISGVIEAGISFLALEQHNFDDQKLTENEYMDYPVGLFLSQFTKYCY